MLAKKSESSGSVTAGDRRFNQFFSSIRKTFAKCLPQLLRISIKTNDSFIFRADCKKASAQKQLFHLIKQISLNLLVIFFRCASD